MTHEVVRQTSFAIGEVDPINYHRTDLSSYLRAAQSLQNFEIGMTGLAEKRRGSAFLADVSQYALTNSRLLYFHSQHLGWVLVITGDKAFHLFKDFKHVATLSAPYTASQMRELSFCLAGDSVVLAHQLITPHRLYAKNNTYHLDPLRIAAYPSYDFNTVHYDSAPVSYSQSGGALTLTIHGKPGFTEAWVGGAIIGGNLDNPSTPLGYAVITRVEVGGGKTVFTATLKSRFTNNPSAGLRGKDFSIRQPVFSASLGYPGVVAFFQDRLWFASTPAMPLGLFGSKINAFTNFDTGIGLPTDALVYDIGEKDLGSIVALNSGKQLEIYTERAEFIAEGNQESGLTSANFAIRKQSTYPCSKHCRPITYGNHSYFVSGDNSIYCYAFNGFGNAYTAANISLASSHLIKAPIDRALKRNSGTNQNLFIYYLNQDGSIAVYQSNDETHLNAWTPMEFAKDIKVIALQEMGDEVYAILHLTKYNTFHLVQFSDAAIYLDDYQYITLPPNGKITGLKQYEGYSVCVSFQSQDYGSYTVKNGSIQVDNPEKQSGPCTVGLLYQANLKSLPLYAGAKHTDLMKSVFKVYVEYFNSLNFSVNGELVKYQYFGDIRHNDNLVPRSDTSVITIGSGCQRDFHIHISQNSPFPLNLQSISYEITSWGI